MNPAAFKSPFVAIACGGTGGHLFPGLAVAEALRQRGCLVALLVSPKEVDQQAAKSAAGLEIFTLPAVGWQNRNYFSFTRSFFRSFFAARKIFRRRRPDAVLAMGGFTSAPPVFAAKISGAKTFLHESNTIPGKSNRLLARFVDAAFIGFPETAAKLCAKKSWVTGTPVRSGFFPDPLSPLSPSVCRARLGLDPDRPTILVVGGSQGAHGLNELVLSALPLLKNRGWQWLHLAGARDFENVRAAYAACGIPAVVQPFLAEMDWALGAATAAVSRAGASSLAEIAARRLPALLVPLPTAADNHQVFNAAAFAKSGAARLLEQKNASPEKIAAAVDGLVGDEAARRSVRDALAAWHAPQSAAQIAEYIMVGVGLKPGADQ